MNWKGTITFLLTVGFIATLQCFAQSENDPKSKAVAYRLSVGDTISFSVYGQDDLAGEEKLDSEGSLSVPLLGRIKISDLTVSEAESKIKKLFVDEELLRNPEITVSIVAYAPKSVSIFGEVNSPGVIQLPEQRNSIDIVELVALAGDFTEAAKSNSVTVKRMVNKEEKRFKVNVMDMILGEGDGEIFYLVPGDIIYVPTSLF